MRIHRLVLPVTLIAAAAAPSGCGPNNGVGFQVSGTISASVTGGGPNQTSGFAFQNPNGTRVRVDPTLPSGQTTGTTGACSIGPNGRSVQFTRIGDDGTLGLRTISISMPDWAQDSCTNCQHGTISVTLATGATFQGTEQRGGAPGSSQCTFTATQPSSFGMELSVQCMRLAAANDTRTLDVTGTLSLTNCDGPETRNPR